MFDNTCIDIVTYYQTIIFKPFCWGTAYPEEDGNMLSWPEKPQAASLAGRQINSSMAATTKGCKQFFQSAFKEELQPAVRLRSTSAFFSSVYLDVCSVYSDVWTQIREWQMRHTRPLLQLPLHPRQTIPIRMAHFAPSNSLAVQGAATQEAFRSTMCNACVCTCHGVLTLQLSRHSRLLEPSGPWY